MSFEDVATMPMAALQEYLERLPERMAELKLTLADVISLPYMKQRDRADALRDWQERAGARPQATPAAPGILKLFKIGVKHAAGR